MRSNALSQARLLKKTGIAQSTISAVVNGARSLTKEQVVKLAKVFHVVPNVFLKA
jgi:plasmid maintenance system antidote protein VapI